MAYYGGRRRARYNPAAEERRERERKAEERADQARKRLQRLLRQFRRVTLKGEEARAAWAEPQLRSFTIGKLADGTHIQTIVRGSRGRLFLQELSFPGWKFSRLVPRYQTPRKEEEESERDRPPKSSRRDPVSVVVRHTDGRKTTYYRATMTDQWRGSYGGASRKTLYWERPENGTKWISIDYSSIPKPTYRQIRERLTANR